MSQPATPLMPIGRGLLGLWAHLTRRRRLQLLLLVVLAFFGSFAELATIGAVIPFVAALISPQKVLDSALARPFLHFFSIDKADQLLLPVSIAFGVLGLLAAVIRVAQFYASIRFSFGLGTELSSKMFRNTLYQPYLEHTRRNSSELITAIASHTGLLMNYVVLACVLLVGGVITTTSVAFGLLAIDVVTTTVVFGVLGIVYVGTLAYTRARLAKSSSEIKLQSSLVVRVIQEGLGGIRDVLIGHNQAVYIEAYRRADTRLRAAEGYNQLVGLAPRYLIEGFAMCFVAIVAYFLSIGPGGVNSSLPVLAALALGGQRLLPVMQQIYNAISNLRANQAVLDEAVRLLDQPLPPDALAPLPAKLPFEKAIEMRHVSFRYHPDAPSVLNGIKLTVLKGQRVGVIGATGSGKSTLIDVVMGLLPPSGGELLVDGVAVDEHTRRSWQTRVSHVPQSIFLIDGTIAENIALTSTGEPPDLDRIRACALAARIDDTIQSMPRGYDAPVGERGVMLSGGQRQRIGIARALYKDADVMILDEATSALDNETEQDVMRSIGDLRSNLTLFIVAHRLTTLRQCDFLVEISGGVISRSGSYEELVAHVV